jgi:cytochrome c-type biogenesis protein CcmH/NrfG
MMSTESDIRELIKVAEDWTEAIRLDPGDITAYMLRGVAYHRQGKHAEANADWTEVLRIAPDGGSIDDLLRNLQLDTRVHEDLKARAARDFGDAVRGNRGKELDSLTAE